MSYTLLMPPRRSQNSFLETPSTSLGIDMEFCIILPQAKFSNLMASAKCLRFVSYLARHLWMKIDVCMQLFSPKKMTNTFLDHNSRAPFIFQIFYFNLLQFYPISINLVSDEIWILMWWCLLNFLKGFNKEDKPNTFKSDNKFPKNIW